MSEETEWDKARREYHAAEITHCSALGNVIAWSEAIRLAEKGDVEEMKARRAAARDREIETGNALAEAGERLDAVIEAEGDN